MIQNTLKANCQSFQSALIRLGTRVVAVESMDTNHYLANYEIEREIGQGSFATVFLGYEKTTRIKVAIKAVNTAKLNKKLAENLASEITILKEINHPNIIKLYEIQKTESYIYLVMEYCEAGDLSQYLRKSRTLKEFDAQNLLHQLSSALRILWDNNLIHRDLKPQNLLLQQNESAGLVLKIADFGFARYVEPSDLAETLCGSPLYMAPEILRYEKYDARADLWSVGAIAYEMVFGAPPFRADNHIHLLRVIESADDSALKFPPTFTFKQPMRRSSSIPSKFSKEKQAIVTVNIETSDIFRDLLTNLLKKDPNKRISFEDFFSHPFICAAFSRLSNGNNLNIPYTPPTTSQPPILRSSSGSSISDSRRNSQSTIDEVLKLEEDETNSLSDAFEGLEHKPPLLTTVRNCLSLVLSVDRIINFESSQLNSLSLSRLSISEPRFAKNNSVLLLLFYNIDLLENCLELLKTAINRETERSTIDFGNLLKATRAVSAKLDREYDLFDTIKSAFRLHSSTNSVSSLSRSSSSQSVIDVNDSNFCLIKFETLLLNAAFRSAKDGGIQELLEQHDEARSKYLLASFLLKTILNPTELAPITSKFAQIACSPESSRSLNRFIELIEERLK